MVRTKAKTPLRKSRSIPPNVALLIPGELRCLELSSDWIKDWAQLADIFVVTNKCFARKAKFLVERGANCVFIEDDPELLKKEAEVPLGRMQQWLKLNECIKLVWTVEKKLSHRYDYIVKIRTDFDFRNPSMLLDMTEESRTDGLFARSDQCFSGRREFVMPLFGFYRAMFTAFYQQDDRYFPINPDQIINSDLNAGRWYWMRFPANLVNFGSTKYHTTRESLVEFRESIKRNREKILRFVHDGKTPLTPALGFADFSSERAFFNYLNFLDIPAKTHPKFAGRLFHTRSWAIQPLNARHFFQTVFPKLIAMHPKINTGAIDMRIRFNVRGKDGGSWVVDLDNAKINNSGEADFVVEMDESDLMAFILRRTKPKGEMLKAAELLEMLLP